MAMKEKRGGENKNRWEILRSQVMRYGIKQVTYPIKETCSRKGSTGDVGR